MAAKRNTPILDYKDSIPIIAVERRGGLFTFWCEHCRKRHIHSPFEGHRESHCYANTVTPFTKRGYYLREVKTDDRNAAVIEREST